MSELDEAKRYFAQTYCNTGCEWDEACDYAEQIAADAKDRGCGRDEIIQRLYSEACRYEDM